MKILITGGAGFIGSSLCISLKEKYPDYSIIAFDNLRRRGSEMNIIEFKELGIEFIHGDIRNSEDLTEIGFFDLLIEASAEPSVLSGLNTEPTYVVNNNLFGSINCFNTCLKYNAKLIFLSTSRVYPVDRIENASFEEEETRFSFSANQIEMGISELGISEELNLMGYRSFYGATKLASELFIQEYSKFYGIQAAVTRLGLVAGPRQMGKTDQGVVTLWMAKHYWRQSLNYFGYGGLGKQVRDILHIEDLIELIDLQIHHIEKFNGKVFNAGGGIHCSASLQEMTKMCEEITGNKIQINSVKENRPADLKVYITNNTSIKNEIDWKPKQNIENIFTDIYKWISKNENDLKHILK